MTEQFTPEQIERAAEAIQQTFANKSGRGRPWSEIPDRLKRGLLKIAKRRFGLRCTSIKEVPSETTPHAVAAQSMHGEISET